jgi:hypothetical protein
MPDRCGEGRLRFRDCGHASVAWRRAITIDLAGDRVDSCRAQQQHLMQSCPAEWHLQRAFALGAQVLLDLYVGADMALTRRSAGWQGLRHHMILTNERFRIFFVFVFVHGLAALASTGCRRRPMV